MATETLKLIIEANADNAVKGVNKFNSSVNAIPSAVGKATTSLNSVKPGADKAAFALTNIGRIAQDAPFGFIAIQNNLSPLIESFGRLQAETGSASGAFKALGKSLIGPAGIGLAFSVVTSLVTVAIQKYGSLGNALNELFGNLTAAEQASRALAKSQADAVADAAAEQAALTALVSIARNKTLSDATRQQAIDKLNDDYDKYLPKLTKENIETQKVTDSIDKLNASLFRQAQIKGVQQLITDEAKKQAELYLKIRDRVEGTGGNFAKLADAVKSFVLSGGQLDFNQIGIIGDNAEIVKSEQRLKSFNDFLKNLFTQEATAGTLFANDIEKKLKEKKDKLAKESKLIKSIPVFLDLTTKETANPFAKQLQDLAKAQQDPEWLKIQRTNIAAAAAEFDKLVQKQQDVASALNTLLAPAFTGLFEGLITGSKNAFSQFIKGIQQVIARLAAAAATAAIFAAIITAVTGGTSFAANFGKIFGQLSGLGSALGGLTGGAIKGQAALQGSALRGQVVVMETQIRGQDLYLIQKQQAFINGRQG